MTDCWTVRGDWIEETYGYLSEEYLDYAATQYEEMACDELCMLPVGHFGPHRWTPSDQIIVMFEELKPEVDAAAPRMTAQVAVRNCTGRGG